MEQSQDPQKRYSWRIISGTTLMVLSTIIFFAMAAIPFLKVDGKTKVTLTTIMFISMEVFWWVGVLIIGKEIYSKYKHLLNPVNWFRKKVKEPDQENSE